MLSHGAGADSLVELVDECSLDNLGLLRGRGGTNCRRRASVHYSVVVSLYRLAGAAPLPHGAAQDGRSHRWEGGGRDIHGVSRRGQGGRGRGRGENGDGLVQALVVRISGEGALADVCC